MVGGVAHTVAFVALALWPLSEVALAIWIRVRGGMAASERRSTALLWAALAVGIGAGTYVSHNLETTAVPLAPAVRTVGATVLVLAGLAVRWTAIVTLGRMFTIDVGLRREHRLVTSGIYRLLRHPSYTGLLLCVLAVSAAHANWLGWLVVLVPALAAVLYRIRVEELALRRGFGDSYAAYCAHSWRLVPWIY